MTGLPRALEADQWSLSPNGKLGPTVLLFRSTTEQMVLDQLSPSQKTAFLSLSPIQRGAFVHVFLQLGQEAGKAGADKIFTRAVQDLAGILADGTLLAKDRDQTTILDHLGQFLHTPLDLPRDAQADPQRYRLTQLAQVIDHVSHPLSIHQGYWSTCGGTSAQIDLAINFPAQYVAFALGLLSRTARGTLPGGLTLQRAPDSLHSPPQDVRPAVSRMVQSTFMREANAGDYATDDSKRAMDPFGGGQIHSLVRGESVRFLVDANLENWRYDSLTQGVRHTFLFEAIQSDLARQASQGRPLPLIPVTLKWTQRGHQVLVTQVTDERVYLINPHENQFAALKANPKHREGVEFTGPKRGLTFVEGPYPGKGPDPVRIYADGTQSMSKELFDARMSGTVVDSATASHYTYLDRFNPPF